MSSFKEINISNPGTSSKFGGDDTDLVHKLLNGTIAGIPAVVIRSQNKWGFGDGIAWFYNQAANRKTTIRGQSNTPSTDVDLKLPATTNNDTLAAIGITNIFSAGQKMDAGVFMKLITEPANAPAGYITMYTDSADGHYKSKDSTGVVTDLTSAGGGGGSTDTASNVGTAGIGVFKTKSAGNFQFKKLNPTSGSSWVTITDDTANSKIDINVLAATTSLKGVVELATNGETAAGVVVQGDDSRLSNSRTPTPHATSHKSGGSDAIKLDELAVPTDVLTLNSSLSAHGLLKKLDNDSTHFMNGQGNWASPAGSASPQNVNVNGIGVWKARVGSVDQFYGLIAASEKVLVQLNPVTNEIEIDVVEENLDKDNMSGTDLSTIKLDDLAAPDDNTDLNSSTTKHGLLRKLDNNGTHFLDGQGNWSTAGGSPVLNRSVSTQDVVNTTTETSVYSYSVPGGTLSTSNMLRLTLICDYLNNAATAETITFKVKYGATTLYNDLTNTIGTTSARHAIQIDILLAANNATNAQVLGGRITISDAGGTTSGIGDVADDEITANTNINGTSTEDSTAAKTLDVTITHSLADANISFRRHIAILETV